MQLLERGIYLPHVLENGHYYLAVVDSTHNVIRREPVYDLADVPSKKAELREWLDQVDPQVAIQIA